MKHPFDRKSLPRKTDTQDATTPRAGLSRREALGVIGASLALPSGLFGCSSPATEASFDGGVSGRDYDYIVIGAGSAGCPLIAGLLSLPRVRVLVIEAGGSNDRDEIRDFTRSWMLTQPGSDVDWGFRSVPQPALGDTTQSYSAGKVLGGTSSINGMVWVRGHRGDYDRWASLGCPGWDYASVLPAFRRLEMAVGNPAFRGTTGPVYVSDELAASSPLAEGVIQAAVTRGYGYNADYNAFGATGVGYTQLNVRDMVRQDAYTTFVKPHEGNPRLTVMTDTRARRVLIDERRRAYGVEVESGGQTQRFFARGEVIVAAGTVNSAKLLMLSGIGDRDELTAAGIDLVSHVPGVGKNLHDHLISVVVKQLRQPEPPEHVTVMDVCLFAGATPAELGGAPRFQMQSYYMRYGWGSYPSEALALGSIHLHPQSRGTVTLNRDDPWGAPIIDPAFLSAPEDVEHQLAGYKMARELINAPELLDWVVDAEHTPGPDVDTDEKLLAAMRTYSEADFHPVGTCKMGVDPDAVVDSRLRVRGVTGLRVVGAAIMPYVTSGNTNAPSMMIGERLGELMTESV